MYRVTRASIAVLLLAATHSQAADMKAFRDCKNVVDAVRMKQIQQVGSLPKDFAEKAKPLAHTMMELCADGKFAEANVALKELEKVTGPIDVIAVTGPAGGPPAR